jgi:hypothetical protein
MNGRFASSWLVKVNEPDNRPCSYEQGRLFDNVNMNGHSSRKLVACPGAQAGALRSKYKHVYAKHLALGCAGRWALCATDKDATKGSDARAAGAEAT